MGIGIVKAELLALCLEDFLFGIFATLAFMAIVVLLRRGPTTSKKTLLSALCCMIVFATAHILIDFVRAFDAFVPADGSAAVYFANLADPVFLTKSAFMTMQVTFGDCVNIWRCWIVSGRRITPIVLPTVGMLGGFGKEYDRIVLHGSERTMYLAASGIAIIVTIAQASSQDTIFDSAKRWIMPYFILTMCVNIYCTAMILWIIFRNYNPHAVFGHTRRAIAVIIESGSLYTASILGFLSAYFAQSNGQYPALDVVVPLVGIIYCLILLQTEYMHGDGTNSIHTTRVEWPSRRRGSSGEPGLPHYATSPLAIEITREVEQHEMQRTGKEKHDFEVEVTDA
ncbi:hypothetical protein EVG20_g2825 [Dentipellis fragilis]|uniref:Uncharacterized protein n=1 Tax=Dentipellis fragilis TaxID=205917 RepID=A0A4Y9Z7S0_9AGAM|nr:hypothetical protein EVG20_g2825 [Dentipellis fragilis]